MQILAILVLGEIAGFVSTRSPGIGVFLGGLAGGLAGLYDYLYNKAKRDQDELRRIKGEARAD